VLLPDMPALLKLSTLHITFMLATLYQAFSAQFYPRDWTVCPFGVPEDRTVTWRFPWGWCLVRRNALQ